MRGVLVPVGEMPRVVEVNDKRSLVDDLVDQCNTIFPENVSIYVSDIFMYNGMRPNRAIFATEQTAKRGYGSIESAPRGEVASEGDLILIVRGPILVVGYDPHTGDDIDLGDAEVNEALSYFSSVSMPGSGAAASLYMGLAPDDPAPTANDLRTMGTNLPRASLIPKDGAAEEAADLLDATSLYFSHEVERIRAEGAHASMGADSIDRNWVEGYVQRPEEPRAEDIDIESPRSVKAQADLAPKRKTKR